MPITFDTIDKIDNGARFYTADLHVHSFGASADVLDPAMRVEAIIDNAYKEGISILSVTDHNNDLNVLPSIDYGAKHASELLILPGVEITTSNGHLLVYFPLAKADCVRDLLARIEIVGKRGERESHTKRSMAEVISEAERLGGVCVAAHIDRVKTGFEMIVQGYPNSKKDIVTSPGLYGLEFDDPDHLIWYSIEDEPTANGDERKKLAKARLNAAPTAVRARLAAVQNSDAHSIAKFGSQHKNRFLTRYKMNELSFEGFRTALIDPESRVRAIKTIPPSLPRILGMQIGGGFLDGCTFHFSDNLNCLIGGRGAGKSTAIQSLAYGLGLRDEFEEHDNCPDTVVIYCEDANGIRYRYERNRWQSPEVQAKEGPSKIIDVPPDAFRVEFYGQGELAEVAKDPLKNPRLLQEFLDRHIVISDLRETENGLLQELSQNSTQLIPIEATAAQLPGKNVALQDLDTKLKIAESGKLKDLVTLQMKLSAEKSLCDGLIDIQSTYQRGLSLAKFRRDYKAQVAAAGTMTVRPECVALLKKAEETIKSTNAFLKTKEKEINAGLMEFSKQLKEAITGLQTQHRLIDQEINTRITEFQKKGLSGDIKGLNNLIQQKGVIQTEIMRIKNQQPELNQLRQQRTALLKRLEEIRERIATRRKSQLSTVNQNLRKVIEDYAVNLYYEPSGIIDEFKDLVLEVMHGTYFPEETARSFCSHVSPSELAAVIRKQDISAISKIGNIGSEWASKIVREFKKLTCLHALEAIAKPPQPIIKVLTKASKPKQLNVNQLSDGQKHTILLTIAMLAESNDPLIMDQPEDDLDNAFIFKSVVSTLRAIKERRQVILVTHNANIAVLGDSELLLPMKRTDDIGAAFDRGSVDRHETKEAVQDILEGGELAFRRRHAIYGY